MAQKRTGEVSYNMRIGGQLDVDETLNVDGAAAIVGALTCSSTVTASGVVTINAFKLVQTLGGTDVTATWGTAGAPALTTGMSYATFTAGASTFRIPCWPTT